MWDKLFLISCATGVRLCLITAVCLNCCICWYRMKCFRPLISLLLSAHCLFFHLLSLFVWCLWVFQTHGNNRKDKFEEIHKLNDLSLTTAYSFTLLTHFSKNAANKCTPFENQIWTWHMETFSLCLLALALPVFKWLSDTQRPVQRLLVVLCVNVKSFLLNSVSVPWSFIEMFWRWMNLRRIIIIIGIIVYWLLNATYNTHYVWRLGRSKIKCNYVAVTICFLQNVCSSVAHEYSLYRAHT